MIESLNRFEALHGPIVHPPESGRFTGGMELSLLLTLACRMNRKKILELSCAYGDTAVRLASANKEAEVFAFDVAVELGGLDFDHYRSSEVLSLSQVGSAIKCAPPDVRERIHFRALSGHEIHRVARTLKPYDFIYIDGRHDWRFVAEDTKLAVSTATEEAVLVWDDYWEHCPEVRHFIDVLNIRLGRMTGVKDGPIKNVEGTKLCYIELGLGLPSELKQRLEVAVEDL